MSSISFSRQSGLSLVELMVALTIGLLLLSGLTLVFVNSSEANRELQKTAQQIENGRYATETISQDLRLAGFYGHFHELPAAPAALPDPCEIADAGALHQALALPVQGYRAPDLATVADVTASTCDDKGLLTAANLQRGSDILVIRRADTNALARPGGVAATGEFYLQGNAAQVEVQVGNGAAIGATNKASGGVSTLFLNDAVTPVPIRKLHVRVYFVAPCSVGSGANGVCQGGDDAIPTLKRLELVATGGVAAMRLTPLVEGIEYLKLEYGIDDTPSTINTDTGLAGNATVDSYAATPAAWTDVIAAKVYVLARNTLPTSGFNDDKTYALGTANVPAANDAFRRHVYTAAVRLMNTSGRREAP